jgi:phosphoribosylaminoimidazolecarboxamide formyltransferase/IMP cyclohydrolase
MKNEEAVGIAVKRALLSVSDKRGIVELARELNQMGIEMVSTGGTFNALREAGLPIVQVSQVTGFPEMLDGRVKTLHPLIHGGILARRDSEDHLRQLAQHAISPIDLVVVNLYPFQSTISRPGCTPEEAVEQIDIGGPCLIRAAAKNHSGVVVVVNADDYDPLIEEMKRHNGKVSGKMAFRLASRAFEMTSAYDRAIVDYLTNL